VGPLASVLPIPRALLSTATAPPEPSRVFTFHCSSLSYCPLFTARHFPSVYNCCKGEKVVIPPYKSRPELSAFLTRFDGNSACRSFIQNIRQYNCLFVFTSIGVNIDNLMNDGCGPPVFKISGQVHHRIGSLLPTDDTSPKYIQLYIYDTANEVKNRIKCLTNGETIVENLDTSIVQRLMKILDQNNPFP
jgi:hypothetical protein